jgi:hypothetical protein
MLERGAGQGDQKELNENLLQMDWFEENLMYSQLEEKE